MRAGAIIARTAGLAALGLLAGCINFGTKPPKALLSIETQARVTPGQTMANLTQNALFVELPATPKSLATQRVAVRAHANQFAYVKQVMWVDLPARQFQALLSETIAARTGRLVLDPGQYPAQTGHVLHGELIEFGIDAQTGQAIVTYDASLLAPDGQTVRRQRFTASRPVAKIKGETVAPAISAAANEVAAAVSDWLKTQ